MRLRFAHLAEYAMTDTSGKLSVMGIFEIVYDNLKVRPIPLPPAMYVVAAFDAHVAEGSDHTLDMQLTDADGKQVLPAIKGLRVKFQTQGPGRPLRGAVVLGLGGVPVPDLGEYGFQFFMDGKHVGETTFRVTEPPVAKT